MPLREIKGAIHVHTDCSDGSGSVAEVMKAAAAAGLDFVVISDHDTTEARLDGGVRRRSGVLPVVGVEISPGGRGHCLVLGATDVTGYRWMPERFFLRKLIRDGADTYIAHPEGRVKRRFGINLREWRAWDHERFTGIEIWSYMHDWIDKVGYLNLPAFYLDPDRGIDGPDGSVLGLWDRLNVHRRVVGLGALDAHAVKMLFGALTAFRYEFLFRTVLTHVLVREWGGDEAADAAELRASLRAGRAFICYNVLASGEGFEFAGEDGLSMGDRAPLGGGRMLVAATPRPAEITLLRNGRKLESHTGGRMRFRADREGVYRIEARIDGRPWIFSNPIYLGGDDESGAIGR